MRQDTQSHQIFAHPTTFEAEYGSLEWQYFSFPAHNTFLYCTWKNISILCGKAIIGAYKHPSAAFPIFDDS